MTCQRCAFDPLGVCTDCIESYDAWEARAATERAELGRELQRVAMRLGTDEAKALLARILERAPEAVS